MLPQICNVLLSLPTGQEQDALPKRSRRIGSTSEDLVDLHNLSVNTGNTRHAAEHCANCGSMQNVGRRCCHFAGQRPDWLSGRNRQSTPVLTSNPYESLHEHSHAAIPQARAALHEIGGGTKARGRRLVPKPLQARLYKKFPGGNLSPSAGLQTVITPGAVAMWDLHTRRFDMTHLKHGNSSNSSQRGNIQTIFNKENDVRVLVSSLLESCPGYAAGLAPAVEVKRRGAQVGLVLMGHWTRLFVVHSHLRSP